MLSKATRVSHMPKQCVKEEIEIPNKQSSVCMCVCSCTYVHVCLFIACCSRQEYSATCEGGNRNSKQTSNTCQCMYVCVCVFIHVCVYSWCITLSPNFLESRLEVHVYVSAWKYSSSGSDIERDRGGGRDGQILN